MLNADVLSYICCPDCKSDLSLSENEKSLLCNGIKQHCFDFASSGYINLSHSSLSGDSKEAVRARKRFLESGGYKPFSDRLNQIVKDFKEDAFIVDMGCGEGYYTVNMLSFLPFSSAIGFDLSKFAVDLASKYAKKCECKERSLFAISSIFSSPLMGKCADVVLNLFAPCAEEEFCRILKDDGILIIVGAGKNHLIELKSALYDVPRQNDERKDLPESMALLSHECLKYSFTPNKEERQDLFEMTPYFYRTSDFDKKKLNDADIFSITAEFDIYIYKKD